MKAFIPVFVVVTCLAFVRANEGGIDVVYGVSHCDDSQVELHLTENLTFSYQDFSDPNHKIKTQGTYTLKNDRVVLKSESSTLNFHKRWSLSKDRTVARSRKGLTFYTLRKLE